MGWWSYLYLPVNEWLNFSNPTSSLIGIKLILLALTILLAVHARFFIIPKLNEKSIPLLASHIFLVTLIGILFLTVGLSFRLGFLF
jgi:hypothetical protein